MSAEMALWGVIGGVVGIAVLVTVAMIAGFFR